MGEGLFNQMELTRDTVASRRALLKTGGLFAGAMMIPSAVAAGMRRAPQSLLPAGLYEGHSAGGFTADSFPADSANSLGSVRPALMRRAMAALQQHGSSVARHDRIAIADFAASSGRPRFHLVNLEDGRTTSKLVAHGSGSDPAHTGYLQRFSNANGSNASCEGAFLTSDYYVGKHGKSQRLIGLDHTNNNALDRAIVVHAAWYANREMVAERGMLGRSQGCFAVGENELAEVFERLGPGRMIYAAKV